MTGFLSDVWLMAAKDLRIEWRSRVVLGQIVPFAFMILLVFGFALDPDRGLLEAAAPGLFWIAVALVSLIAAQRSATVEQTGGALDGLRMSAVSPAAMFLGKTLAVFVQLCLLEVLLAGGVVVFFDRGLGGWGLLVVSTLVATFAIAAAAVVAGLLAQGTAAGETLLPVLLLPSLVPVLLGATQAWEVALGGPGDGWGWVALCGLVAVLAASLGAAAFGPLLDEG